MTRGKDVKIQGMDNGWVATRVVTEGEQVSVPDARVFLDKKELMAWLDQNL